MVSGRVRSNESTPRCVRCAEPIGVYERLWFDAGDGRIRPSSLLNLRDGGHDLARLAIWHRECLPADHAASTAA